MKNNFIENINDEKYFYSLIEDIENDNFFNFLPIPTFFYIKAIFDHSKLFIENIEFFNL